MHSYVSFTPMFMSLSACIYECLCVCESVCLPHEGVQMFNYVRVYKSMFGCFQRLIVLVIVGVGWRGKSLSCYVSERNATRVHFLLRFGNNGESFIFCDVSQPNASIVHFPVTFPNPMRQGFIFCYVSETMRESFIFLLQFEAVC